MKSVLVSAAIVGLSLHASVWAQGDLAMADRYVPGAFGPSLEYADRCTPVALSPDATMMASARNGTIKIWDVATRKNTAKIEAGSVLDSLAFSPDGRILASVASGSTIELWEVATGKNIARFRGETALFESIGYSPDGRIVAAAGDTNVRLWDVNSGRPRAILEGHLKTVFSSVAFNPNGRTLASSGVRTLDLWNVATISVWDVATGENIANLSIHGPQYRFSALAFSPDGSTLAAGRGDGMIYLWDAVTGRVNATLSGHTSRVRALAFSPNSATLASASQDGTIKLWDAATGKNTATQNGNAPDRGWRHGDGVSLAFSPDGGTLVWGSAGSSTTIGLWDVAKGRKGAK